MSSLRAVWRLLRALLHAIAGWLTITLLFPRWSQQRREATVQAWSQRMLRILGIPLHVQGQAPARGPLLLVSNPLARRVPVGVAVSVFRVQLWSDKTVVV